MQKYFWNQWPAAYKYTYLFFLLLFGGSILWMAIGYFLGSDNTLDWNILAQADKAEVIINTFKIGPFNLSQSIENTIFFQKYAGTSPAINSSSYYLFLIIFTLIAVLFITIISTLTRFWYFVGIALFAFFLVSLKLELLQLFGSSKKIGLIVAIILYLPVSYYFNSIKSEISFFNRFLVFLLITTSFAVFVYFSAEVPNPFFYISTSLLGSAFLISLIFVFSVAHEIIAAFVYLLYGGINRTAKNSFLHLIVISVFYLTNLVLALLYETHVIDWDFLYVNVFLLLAISAILGVWGFRQREPQYESITKFYPIGALAFLGLGIICFVTIGHLHTTGNDAGLEIFRDFILYSHVGFGIIFLLYFISNFISLIKSNLSVYKVLYKPTNMPYFTFRFAGLIVVAAFVFKSNWQVPLYQGIAAYYNSVADSHIDSGEKQLATRYYEEAGKYALHNHKSNYALASMSEKSDANKAIVRYQEAIKKWPSPQAYVNLSNLYLNENRFFDALFNAKEAVILYPKNAQVLNTLGLIYGKTSIIDSAIYYLDKASKLEPKKGSAVSNIMALLAKNEFSIPVDSVLNEYQIGTDPISINNKLVLANQSHRFLDIPFENADSVLSLIEANILGNTTINSLFDNDTVSTKSVTAFGNHSSNISFKESLEYAACLQLYKNGDINQSFRRLNWLANTSQKMAAKYFDDIGLWALDQGAADVAIEYFQWSRERGHEDAALHLAIALSENKNIDAAKQLWNELALSKNEDLKDIAQNMLAILSMTPEATAKGTDAALYMYCRYQLSAFDNELFISILPNFEDPNYKAKAILDMANKLWKQDFEEKAIEIYSLAAELEISDPSLFESIQFFELRMLAATGNIRGLANKINQGTEFSRHLLEKAYFTGLISEASGDTTAAAKNYNFIAKRNPFYEEAVIASADFINKQNAFESYHVLLNALEINPRSIKLLKAYITQCAIVQQNTSAEIALETLKTLVSKQEYLIVESTYNKTVQQVNDELAKF